MRCPDKDAIKIAAVFLCLASGAVQHRQSGSAAAQEPPGQGQLIYYPTLAQLLVGKERERKIIEQIEVYIYIYVLQPQPLPQCA